MTALLAGLLLLLCCAADARGAGRVVLLGVDGLAWSVVDPMVEAGEMPHLAALLARGVQADMETVEPVVSPVVWTSIATSRSPDAHGVGGFMGSRLVLKTPTVFERLAAGGKRVGLYEYLVTWPPPDLPDGFVVPGWMRRGPEISPPDLWLRTGVAPFRVDYDGLYSRQAYIDNIRAELTRKPATFTGLLRAWRPDVAATILYAPDRVSHRHWLEAWPDEDGGLPREESLVREVMRGTDAAIGKVAAALRPEDLLIVVSDHGFQRDEPRQVWVGRTRDFMARAGLDGERDGFSLSREWGAIVVRVRPGPFTQRDATLERLAAFFGSARGPGGEALLSVWVIDAVERPPGKERSLWNRALQWGFRTVVDWFFGFRFDEPAHGWVVARFDADAMQALWPDGTVEIAGAEVRAETLAFREDFDGGHHPTAVFLAAGGPLRHLPGRGEVSVLDVAPLVAYAAGAPIPDDMEGVLRSDWIEPAFLRANPPRRVAAAEAPRLAPSVASPRPEIGDPAMQERLRSLGYLE